MNWRRPGRMRRYLSRLSRGVGPELVSAASDNDPANIGTAVAVGAKTGYLLSWLALLVALLLAVVLAIAAAVAGSVTAV
jgi:Mn2+/Fe2+ NRAMP family transporter